MGQLGTCSFRPILDELKQVRPQPTCRVGRRLGLGVAVAARAESRGGNLLARAGELLLVVLGHPVDRAAAGQVKHDGVGVEDIRHLGRAAPCGLGRCGGVGVYAWRGVLCRVAALVARLGHGLRRAPALARCVVDVDARLHVVAKDVERHARPVVLDRLRLEVHPARDELVAHKDRGRAKEHTVAGGAHVVGHLVLKREHPLNVEVARAGDEVALVGVLARELEPDEVAAVKEVSVGDEVVIAHGVPAGWADHADGGALLGGHGGGAHDRLRRAAAPEAVERAVRLLGPGEVGLGEGGDVVVDDGVGAPSVGGNLGEVEGRVCVGGGGRLVAVCGAGGGCGQGLHRAAGAGCGGC